MKSPNSNHSVLLAAPTTPAFQGNLSSFSYLVLGYCKVLSVSSPAEGQEMSGLGVLHWNSSSLEHFGGTDTEPGLVCLSLFLLVPLSGLDLILLRGGGCQPKFLLVAVWFRWTWRRIPLSNHLECVEEVGVQVGFFTKSSLGFGLETLNSNERLGTEIK